MVICSFTLTDLPLVPHIYVTESAQLRFRQWLVAYSAPSQYLNQCWFIVNWTLRNKLQWNSNQNSKNLIHEKAFENVVCEKAAILPWGISFIGNMHPYFNSSWLKCAFPCHYNGFYGTCRATLFLRSTLWRILWQNCVSHFRLLISILYRFSLNLFSAFYPTKALK